MTRRGRTAGRPVAAPWPGGDRPRGGDGPRGGDRPRADLAARRARLCQVIEPVVLAAGCDLESLSVSRAGRRHVVRVVIDADDGVSLDAVAEVSRAVSAALDAAEQVDGELVAGEYQLEVSSPGVDRPLTLPRHWRRNVGRLVKVTVAHQQLTGRVVAADAERVVFDLDGEPGEWRYAELGPGRVQVEFSRLDEPVDEDLDETDDVDDDQEEAVIR